jgi:predicted house-cleaning noncanonical NTP pyrophosphatase (MazG superfamily)
MLKFKFDKLVRDKIVDQQVASGAKPTYQVLDRQGHIDSLVKKISEEATEIVHALPDEVAGEIADVQQILDDLAEVLGLKSDDIRKEQQLKAEKAGTFQRGLYVEYVEVNDDNAWLP